MRHTAASIRIYNKAKEVGVHMLLLTFTFRGSTGFLAHIYILQDS
jgi:hypothetical protein